MIERGFMEEKEEETNAKEWWHTKQVSDLRLQTPITVAPSVTCNECVEILNKNGYDQLPCLSATGEVEGMVTLGNLTSQILSGRVKGADPISKVLYRQFQAVSLNTKLSQLNKAFDKDHFALVTTTQKNYQGPEQVNERTVVYGIVTRIDLLSYILANTPKN
jgi:cystathionine beta-synthase